MAPLVYNKLKKKVGGPSNAGQNQQMKKKDGPSNAGQNQQIKKKDGPSNIGENQHPSPANKYGFAVFQPPTTNEGWSILRLIILYILYNVSYVTLGI